MRAGSYCEYGILQGKPVPVMELNYETSTDKESHVPDLSAYPAMGERGPDGLNLIIYNCKIDVALSLIGEYDCPCHVYLQYPEVFKEKCKNTAKTVK